MLRDTALTLVSVTTLYSLGMVSVITTTAAETLEVTYQPIDMYISYNATSTTAGATTTAHITLATYHVPLNAFEVELKFDPREGRVVKIEAHPDLCEPRFMIEETIDHEAGVIYLSCGSATPFITGTEFMPVLTLTMISALDVLPLLEFGRRTGFHIHDGLGTKAVTNIQNA